MSTTHGPGTFLTASDLLYLYQRLGLGEIRKKARGRDERLYDLLRDMTEIAFTFNADNGNERRQTPAIEKTEYTTVPQVARAAGLSERTVRLDAEHQILPATKNGGKWNITATDADAYIAARRKK